MANFDDKIDKKLTFSTKYTKGEQKRKNPRIPVDIKGTFIYRDAENTITEKCIINSLSTGGVSFNSSVVLLKGDVIVISFLLGNTPIKVDCKVTRTHGKEVGSSFVNPTVDDVKYIQQFIFKKVFS